MKCAVTMLVVSAVVASVSAGAEGNTEARLNFLLDVSRASVAGNHLSWSGREGEVEFQWRQKTSLFAGVAVGIRKEGQYYTDGTYLAFRAFGNYHICKRFAVHPSLGLIYGLPGPSLMKVADGEWVFPVRGVNIPGTEVSGDGVLYPELSASLRVRLWILSLDQVAGIRLIRFGVQRNDDYSGRYRVVPTAGFRIGFRLN